MAGCCSGENSCSATTDAPRKSVCPQNSRQYLQVEHITLLQHLRNPWQYILHDEEQFYFCDDPDCDVVYFNLTGKTITQAELRTKVGIKSRDDRALSCYCFGVTHQQARDPGIKQFVVEQTKKKNCACDIRNPSGRCCLKDFPKN